ncbi:Aste57867_25460 [Aphanomyces stellatus]|uniref:Aste57867_25460 protein n=1 Tax=Aphanomyces stellatus TaxID=120398 RepID=A0A485LT81_9STRA|nr:hypothetical protein As57867_025381 [Aphanomyces stellatus]VFU02083.1 Aste57867_25460 [Aphanomyces stellatus]
MKRNAFDIVAHAHYLADADARVRQGRQQSNQVESYRKYKYKQRVWGDRPPVVPATAPDDDDAHASNQPPLVEVSSWILDDRENDPDEAAAVLTQHRSKEHEYLMQLICPALRHTERTRLTPLVTSSVDAFHVACPCARDGASLTPCGPLLVLFGGCYRSDPGLLHPRAVVAPRHSATGTIAFSNHVHVYTPATSLWDVPRLTGTTPRGRADHSASFVSTSLVVFGGRGKGAVVFHDLFVLCVNTWTWSEVRQATPPPPRFWHATTTSDASTLFLFGGKDLYSVYGDLYQLDTSTLPIASSTTTTSSRQPRPSLLAAAVWQSVTAVGQPPPPRFGATLHSLGDGHIAVVGGWQSRSVPLTESRWLDLFVLDTVAWIWSRPHLAAHFHPRHIPRERLLFSSFLVDSTTLIVFGGYTYGPVTAADTRAWFEVEPPPKTVALPTPARFMHGMALHPIGDATIYTLHLDVMVWRHQPHPSELPTAVSGGAGAVLDGVGYVASISHEKVTETLLVAVHQESSYEEEMTTRR